MTTRTTKHLIKRSAVPTKVPTTTDLALGELAINTYDGKLYLKRDDGAIQSIVEIGSGGGSGGASITIADEGTGLTSSVASINFVGDGVTATNTGDNVTVTIPGGGSGGSFDQSNVAITGGSISGVSLHTLGEQVNNIGFGVGGLGQASSDNLAIGNDALLVLPSPVDENDFSKSFNVAIGVFALRNLAYGSNNLAIGGLALYETTGCWDNVAIGAHAGQFLTSGGNNILLGTTAGGGNWMDSYLQEGSNNIYIGSSSRPLNTIGDSNCIVIGADNVGLGSNTTMIGTSSTELTKVAGKLLIDKAPTSAVGAEGDKAGMIASDASYLYHCNADYDGTTAIWGRLAIATW